MKNLTKRLLWGVAGSYLLFRAYQNIRYPSPYSTWFSTWFTPYADILLAGAAFSEAFGRHHQTSESSQRPGGAPERLTRGETITFRVLGLPVVLFGLFLLGLAGWFARDQWVRTTRWPRANAILTSKEISITGARLVFVYQASGQKFTGVAFRFGPEKTVEHELQAYELGTVQTISYDPEDPAQVETMLGFSWELFRGPVSAAALGLFFVVGGAAVYRWSYGRFLRR